jgi:hypothetical protein
LAARIGICDSRVTVRRKRTTDRRKEVDMSSRDQHSKNRSLLLRRPIAVPIGIGCLSVVAYGMAQANEVEAVAVGLLVALAATAVGALLGVVFGIPRRVENSPVAAPRVYAGNTNLEQISDWIVKIIVALGLIELGSLATWFTGLSRSLGVALGQQPGNTVAAAGVLAFFTPVGFLAGYLWARTEFTAALEAGEREVSVDRQVEVAHESARRVDRQAVVEIAAGRDFFVEHHEPVYEVPPHQVAPTSDLMTLSGEIEDVLAALVLPIDSVDLSQHQMIRLLSRRGVLEPELAQALKEIADAAGQVASGVPVSENSQNAVRARGAALVSSLARLRRVAARRFEQRVLSELAAGADAGWEVDTDRRIGDTSADAVVIANGKEVVVEARVLANRVGGRRGDLVNWVRRLPSGLPVLLVLTGDRSNAPNVTAWRDGVTRVLMWDEEADELLPAIAELLAA